MYAIWLLAVGPSWLDIASETVIDLQQEQWTGAFQVLSARLHKRGSQCSSCHSDCRSEEQYVLQHVWLRAGTKHAPHCKSADPETAHQNVNWLGLPGL